MTRLREDWLGLSNVKALDSELIEKAGTNLEQLAGTTAGVSVPLPELQRSLIAVVPVTVGDGVISGFTESVGAVLEHLGLDVMITKLTDVSGFAEAIHAGAEIIFSADDTMFVAFDLKSGKVIDNAAATAKIYVRLVELMAGGLKGKRTLIIGVGRVGETCLTECLAKDASVWIYDCCREKGLSVVSKYPSVEGVAEELSSACKKAEIIFDASPGAGMIKEDWLSEGVVVGAPGVPLGLEDAALHHFGHRVVHDIFSLGVASMAALTLASGGT